MRRTRSTTIELICPECQGPLLVGVSWPNSEESARVESAWGHRLLCSLAERDDDDRFFELVMKAVEERDQAAYDRDIDSRIEREREGER